jgi:DNA ligase-1
MTLQELLTVSERISGQSSRLQKIELLAGSLRRLEPAEIRAGIAYLSGELPQGRIGVSYATIRQAMPQPAGAGPADTQPSGKQPGKLTVAELNASLESLSKLRGPGSQGKRTDQLRELFGRCTAEQQRFLARLLLGELRQGAQQGLMIEAVARASGLPAASVRRAWMLAGSAAEAAEAAITGGEAALGRFRLQLLRPLQPMLAQTAGSVEEAIESIGQTALEYKLDGARIQVHRLEEEVKVFTRNLNEVTGRVPELVEVILGLPAKRLILDGEAIVLQGNGRPAAFQVTMRRFGRRLDIEQMRRTLPLSFFFFDCLHANGEDLIDRPARERFSALRRVVPEQLLVPRLLTSSAEKAGVFLRQALAAGHEGVMAKTLSDPYEAGRRGGSWLKIKPVHTLDLVVLAAEWGSGRRRGSLSNLHLGARDPEGGFVMLGKTFKGMTDSMLRWQTEKLLELEERREAYTVFVRPELVAEVAFDGVQASSQYTGGLALRFARIRRYRPDKSAEQADSIETVRRIHLGRKARS